MADRQYLERRVKDLTDKGQHIEATWVEFRMRFLPLDATGDQLTDMRTAYFAGACAMTRARTPLAKAAVVAELKTFHDGLVVRYGKPPANSP